MSGTDDFWSRRKAQVAAEAKAEARATEAAELAAREAALAEKSDEELCAELGLPDPDRLEPGDDVRAFMARAVPERLRRRALRRLWLTNPVLANVDGLVDYGQDFTDSACVIENLQTAYQVGKGMLAHVEEMARQAEAEAEAAKSAPEAAEEPPAAVAMAEGDAEPEAEPAQAQSAPADAAARDEIGEAALPPRRRMRFAFDRTVEMHA